MGPNRDGVSVEFSTTPEGGIQAEVVTVGTIGVLYEAKTTARVIRKTPAGPLHPAVCNRWHGHSGEHRMTRGKDFATLAVWGDAECAAPDWKAAKRAEMAVAKARAARERNPA